MSPDFISTMIDGFANEYMRYLYTVLFVKAVVCFALIVFVWKAISLALGRLKDE